MASNDIAQLLAQATQTYAAATEVAKLGLEFVTGAGDETTYHGPTDPMTAQLMNAPGVVLARTYARSYPEVTLISTFGIVGGGATIIMDGHIIQGQDGALSAQNITRQFVGSYLVRVTVDPTGTHHFLVYNETSASSGLLHLPPSWTRDQFGPLGTTRQFYYWAERP